MCFADTENPIHRLLDQPDTRHHHRLIEHVHDIPQQINRLDHRSGVCHPDGHTCLLKCLNVFLAVFLHIGDHQVRL